MSLDGAVPGVDWISRAALLPIIVLVTAVLSGCGSEASRFTVVAPSGAARFAPVAAMRGSPPFCAVTPLTGDLVSLPGAALSADLVWYPGLNGRPCRVYRTHLGQAAVDRLIAALQAVRLPQGGSGPGGNTVACGSDDGSFVQVRFNEHGISPLLRIGLTGCPYLLPADHNVLGPWPQMGKLH